MMGAYILRTLAEIDPSRIARLEQDLTNQSGLIAWVYGGILLVGLALDFGFLLYVRSYSLSWRRKVSLLVWRPIGARDLFVLLIFLGLLQLAAGLMINLLDQFSAREKLNADSVLLVVQSLILHVAGLVMVVALLRGNRVPWKSAFGLELSSAGRRILQGTVFLLATMPPLFFYTFLYHMALQSFSVDAAPQDVLFAISDETSMPMRTFFAFLAAVLAPAFEEVLFRGMILPVLAKRFRIDFSILVVSLLFALVHWNVASFVPLFLLSISFCMAYIYTESLIVPMVMHGLFNMVTVSLLYTVQ